MNAALYNEHLEYSFYAALVARYPAPIHRKHAMLPQHDNAKAGHTADATIKAKIKELLGTEFLSLILRHPTIACFMALWLTFFAAAGQSILWKSSKTGVESFDLQIS